jgi:hypothetical protein
LIVNQRPSNFHAIYNGYLTAFDGLSNDNEIL